MVASESAIGVQFWPSVNSMLKLYPLATELSESKSTMGAELRVVNIFSSEYTLPTEFSINSL